MAGEWGWIAAKVSAMLVFVAAPVAVTLLRAGEPVQAHEPVPVAAAVQPEAAASPLPQASAAIPPAPAPAPVRLAAAAAPASDAFVIKRVLEIQGPFRHGDYVWDESGAPAGPLLITVDIGAQTLSVFRGGYEIGAAVILFGADDKPTPIGTFPIMEKDADHVSDLYDAPMPYMLRLTGDGVAIHGSNVRRDWATNGCIGVPTEFARLLFKVARVGDRVIITNGARIGLGDRIAA